MFIKQRRLFLINCQRIKSMRVNDPQVVIDVPEIMPFHELDHQYTANSSCQGYMDAESLYGIMCVIQ